MPMSVQVLQDHNLLILKATGLLTVKDIRTAFETYATHPQARPGQHIINDLSRLTEAQIDYDRRLQLQTTMEPILALNTAPRTYVMYAPTKQSRDLAETLTRGYWASTPGITMALVETEAQALQLLDLPYDSFADLTSVTATS